VQCIECDERAVADATDDQPFRVQLRQRIVDRVARHPPIRRQLARRWQPGAGGKPSVAVRDQAPS
jgi:hypothetical protein